MSDCIGPTNIIPNNNQVVLQDTNRTITVIDNNCCTNVTVTQPVTCIVQVNTPGPQGPAGSGGGSNIDTGSFATTGSNIFIGNQIITGSVDITGSLTVNTVNVGQNTLNFVDSNNNILTSLSVSGNNLVLSSGSFLASQGGLTGSLLGTASYAITASYALNGGGGNVDTSAFVTTSSFNAFTSSINNATSSFVTNSQTSSFVTNSQTSSFVTNSQTSSFVLNSQTSSFVTNSQTSSFVQNSQTSSFVTNNQTSSFVQNSQTSSFVTNSQTSSFVTNSQTSSFVTNSQTSSFTTTSSFNSFTSSINSFTSSINATTGSFVTTSSFNAFTSSINNATGSFLIIGSSGTSQTISGSLIINQNLTVLGSSSITYVTSSQLNIGTNLITVNTATPAVRFGGLAVYDSGSTGTGKTGSILWDSQNDVWVYSNPSGASYDGAMMLVGPRNSTGLGNEVGINSGYAAVGDGSHHMTSSAIYSSGSLIRLENNTQITGSLIVSAGITGSFTGSYIGPLTGTASWASNAVTASYVLNAVSSSFASTASLAPNYVLNSATSSFVQNSQTSSFVQNSQTSSFVTNSQTSSFVLNSQTSSMTVATASYVTGSIFTGTNSALSSSYASNAENVYSALVTGGTNYGIVLAATGATGYKTLSNTANTTISVIPNVGRIAATSMTASAAFNATASAIGFVGTASNALTSSFINTLNQPVIISGSFTVFTGSAVEFQVTNTGVNIGNISTDIHNVTGSLRVSGSITGSLFGTSSWASNAITASYALTSAGGGTVSTASLLTTASATNNVITFTKGDASTFTVTVATGSGGGGAATFPYTGSAIISGSLIVTGSINQTGSHNIYANQNSVTQADTNGILLGNNSAATVGVQSISPPIVWQGNGWKTTATAGSQDVRWRADVIPVQGTDAAQSGWRLMNSTNGSAYTEYLGLYVYGTNANFAYLDVSSNSQGQIRTNNVYANTLVGVGTQLVSGKSISAGTYGSFATYGTAGGSSYVPRIYLFDSTTNSGNIFGAYETTNGFTLGAYNVATNPIYRASINITNLINTTSSESADLIFSTKPGSPANTAATERLRITSTGNILIGTTSDLGYRLSISGSGTSGSLRIAPSFIATSTTASSVILITGSIQQVQTASAQIYGVNVTPTMVYTTGSQTQTAFRIAPTFSGSAAFSSSQQNIIADFGATSVGTQFSVNDITSGSIYMVNDVSGLPIIEALSDWTVNMYNYPTKVFQKSGSSIIITGSMNITGSLVMSPTSSFILPLTASTSPATGSAYWSGSFLFVYNGTRYMSASFA